MLIVCVMPIVFLIAEEQEVRVNSTVATSVTVDGRHVQFLTTKRPREIQVVTNGEAETLLVELPDGAGNITELRACTWSWGRYPGVAIAVETESRNSTATQPRRSYYWATMRWPEESLPGRSDPQQPPKLELTAVSQFLSDVGDCDITEMGNPGGDTIYVVLSQVDRLLKQGNNFLNEDLTGYLFVHYCPVFDISGALYELRAVHKSET